MHAYLVAAALALTACLFAQVGKYYYRFQLRSARARSNIHHIGSAWFSFLLHVGRFPTSVLELEGFLNEAAGVPNACTGHSEHLLDRAEIDLDDYVGSLLGRTIVELDPINFQMTVVVHAGLNGHMPRETFTCSGELRERLAAA
jgi:hypothetical protein